MAGSDHGLRIIRHWREVGGNAVVFDIKDSDGSVNIAFDHRCSASTTSTSTTCPSSPTSCTRRTCTPSRASPCSATSAWSSRIPNSPCSPARTAQPWRENGKLVWTDPSNPKVQDYDIALAKYVAQLGVDEIQFDYVRFPAEGDQKDAAFVFQNGQPEPRPSEAEQNPVATAASAVPPKRSKAEPPRSRGQAEVEPEDASRRSCEAKAGSPTPRNAGRHTDRSAPKSSPTSSRRPTPRFIPPACCSLSTSSASWPGSAPSTSPTPGRTSSPWRNTATCSRP